MYTSHGLLLLYVECTQAGGLEHCKPSKKSSFRLCGATKKIYGGGWAPFGRRPQPHCAPAVARSGSTSLDGAKPKGSRLSEKGFADAPVTFRKVSQTALGQGMREFRDGSPNPERRVLGGVLVKEPIERDISVNLVALRGLAGRNDEETSAIRAYLLALALMAATGEIDLYLREGCNLRFIGEDSWESIPRRGESTEIDLTSEPAQGVLLDYAKTAAAFFKPDWPEKLVHKFDLREAKKLLAKKTDDEQETGN